MDATPTIQVDVTPDLDSYKTPRNFISPGPTLRRKNIFSEASRTHSPEKKVFFRTPPDLLSDFFFEEWGGAIRLQWVPGFLNLSKSQVATFWDFYRTYFGFMFGQAVHLFIMLQSILYSGFGEPMVST